MYSKLILTLIIGFGLGFITSNSLQPTIKESVYSVPDLSEDNATQATQSEALINEMELAKILADSEKTALSDDKAELVEEVKTLRSQLQKLAKSNQALSTEKTEITNQFEQIKAAFVAASMNQGDNTPSDVTDEELMAHIASPYDSILKNFKGRKRDEINDFYNQAEDFDWGYSMQTNISDFILNHHLSAGVDLASVTCKTDKCDLQVHERNPEEKTWHQIFHEMTIQPWWQFQSTHSSSTNVEGEPGVFIYAFMSQTP